MMVLLDAQIFNFNQYLDGLRTAYLKDLEILPASLQNLVREKENAENAGLLIVFDDFLTVFDDFSENPNAFGVIDFLASDEAAMQNSLRVGKIAQKDDRKTVEDLAGSFRLLQFLIDNLTTSSGIYSKKTAVELLRDDRIRHIFLGLLWHRAEKITFSNGFNLRSELEKMRGKLAQFESFLEEIKSILGAANDLKEAGVNFNYRSSGVENSANYAEIDRYFTGLTNIINIGFRFYLRYENSENAKERIIKFAKLMRWTKDLYFDIRQKKYTAAVADASFLLIEVYGKEWAAREDFIRYGNFMATVSEARTSDEVAAAIDAFALPPGSSRLKKNTQTSLGLNSYPGLGLRAQPASDGGNSFFVPASMGFSANKGLQNLGSLSFYVPVIDVGALFAFRFKDDQTTVQPNIEWENILSPGGYLVYGFGRDIPVSVGLGGQAAPTLKKILPDGSTVFDKKRVFRPNLFLTMDIPITHFYSK
jgi:hypothetical protein